MNKQKRNELHRKLKEFGIPAFYNQDMNADRDRGGLFLIDTVSTNKNPMKRRKIQYYVEPRHELRVYGDKRHRQAVLRVREDARTVKFVVEVNETVKLREEKLKTIFRLSDIIEQCPVAIPIEDIDTLDWSVSNFKHTHTQSRTFASTYDYFDTHYYRFEVEVEVPKTDTYFLLGWDEEDLFICQLPEPAHSVGRAHAILKPEEVGDDYQRQGEYFFVKVMNLPKCEGEAHYNMEIGESDHVAQVIVELHTFTKTGSVEYVSGTITHERHKTLDLSDGWYRVYRNREIEAPEDTAWD
jgi:hypothetical protein